MEDTDGDVPRCECKVGRLVSRYRMESVNEELEARWRGDGFEKQSVRELADLFNRTILARTLSTAGHSAVKSEVESLYHLLTGDVSKGMTAEAHGRLENYGVDVSTLRSEFISHQTMYRHLRNCLHVSKTKTEVTVDGELDRINRLQSRAEAVLGDTVTRLSNADALADDNYRPIVSFRVMCKRCGTITDFADIASHGGCQCQRDGDTAT
ncbi:rod-determining factor RdfA [Haladaptatus sp. ZSTT2]|uniref:rod-determining factor RdfA n=1 Tax=Haladaptatus sp. ZSTT2 TaxID=3120515 RepID=UPI00300E89E6